VSELTEKQLDSAVRYNSWAAKHVFPEGLPSKFVESWMTSSDPKTKEFALSILEFQKENNLEADGKCGTQTFALMHAEEDPQEGFFPLTDEIKSEVIGLTVKFEGGRSKNPYATLNLDYEYEGYFDTPKKTSSGQKIDIKDRTKRHRASKYNADGGFHIGLSYGAWQAAQEPGSLGELLAYMYEDDPCLFKTVFGSDWDELLEMTRSKNRRVSSRSSRVQKLGGKDLWERPWTDRFKEAANHEVFRNSQRRWVAKRYLDPALETAELYNLDSKGALAVLFDIAIQFGVGGMRKRVARALKPNTPFSEDNIIKVINQLPKARRTRRHHILKDAGQKQRYLW